jgi:hypothetical protein
VLIVAGVVLFREVGKPAGADTQTAPGPGGSRRQRTLAPVVIVDAVAIGSAVILALLIAMAIIARPRTAAPES